MAAYFLDSSSLVKRFASELGTAWMLSIIREKPLNLIFAARITFVEVTSSLARKAHAKEITPLNEDRASRRLKRAFDRRINNVEITEALVVSAARLSQKHLLLVMIRFSWLLR